MGKELYYCVSAFMHCYIPWAWVRHIFGHHDSEIHTVLHIVLTSPWDVSICVLCYQRRLLEHFLKRKIPRDIVTCTAGPNLWLWGLPFIGSSAMSLKLFKLSAPNTVFVRLLFSWFFGWLIRNFWNTLQISQTILFNTIFITFRNVFKRFIMI